MTEICVQGDLIRVETEHRGRSLFSTCNGLDEAARELARLQFEILDLKDELAETWRR